MPLLLLRGLAREKRHWGDFPARIGARVADEVLTLDLPGFGTQSDRPVPSSMAGIVEDVRARFLRERAGRSNGAGLSFTLVGISLGGMVTLDWAARYPQDFARVAVINTSSALSSPLRRFLPANYPTILRAVLARSDLERERAILSFTVNSPTLDREAIAQQWAGWARELRPRHTAFLRQLFAASRWRVPQRLAVPLLVLASRADRLVSFQCSEAIAARLGAPLELHDSGGHDLSLDAPEWLIDRLAGFVGSARVAA